MQSRTLSPENYCLKRRIGAFLRGLPELEPFVNIAREGLETEGVSNSQRAGYALRIAESGRSSCHQIHHLVKNLSKPMPSGVGVYRSSMNTNPIPPVVQHRLCELFKIRYEENFRFISKQMRKEKDPSNVFYLESARYGSIMEKARAACDMLKSGAINSTKAQRELISVIQDATKSVEREDAESLLGSISQMI